MSTSLPPSSVTNVSPINASLASQIALPLPGGTDFTTLDKRLERVFYDTDFDSIGDAMALFAANSTERYQFVMTEENVVVSGLVIPGNLDITCIADGQFTDGGVATALEFTTGVTLRSQWAYPFSDLMTLTGDVLCDIGGGNPYILLIAAAGSIYRTNGTTIGVTPDIFISLAHNSWYSFFTGSVSVTNWVISFSVQSIIPGRQNVTVEAPALLDSQIIWTRPDGTVFTGKTPASAQFTLTGAYTLWALDQAKVLGFNPTDFYSMRLNINTMTWPDHLLSFNILSAFLQGDLDTVVFPATLTTLASSYASSTLTGVLENIALPPALETLAFYHMPITITGDITSVVWPTTITKIDLRATTQFVGDISTLVLPAGARTLWLGSTSVTGDLTSATNLQNLTSVDLSYTSVTGDLSTIVWSADIEAIVLTSLALTNTEVDDFLVALETNHLAAAGTLFIAGTNAVPTATGLTARTNLIAAGWTITVST